MALPAAGRGGALALIIVMTGAWFGLWAQEAPVFSGQWTATVGEARAFRGKWVGQILLNEPDKAHGSWTLTDENGRTTLSGIWTARKAASGWQGTWSATDTGGRRYSGKWSCRMDGSLEGTFETLLERTTRQEVAGSWQMGSLRGFWWLRGSLRPAGNAPPEEGPPKGLQMQN